MDIQLKLNLESGHGQILNSSYAEENFRLSNAGIGVEITKAGNGTFDLVDVASQTWTARLYATDNKLALNGATKLEFAESSSTFQCGKTPSRMVKP
jgi:hypothetical protein